MKKWALLLTAVCLLLAGCGKSTTDMVTEKGSSDTVSVETEAAKEVPGDVVQEEAPAYTVRPLPDSTMENLTDAILAVSFKKGDAYVDDTGKMQMNVKIFTYDKYDVVGISKLEKGDSIVTHAGEVRIGSLERGKGGTLYINGGVEEGGLELITDESVIFYETGLNDTRNWYEVGEATIRVSVDFEAYDLSDPAQGERIFYPGSFLNDEVTNYDFTPYNTTIRVEAGQIVELIRRYVP